MKVSYPIKLFTFVIAVFPILNVYTVFEQPLGDIALVISITLLIFQINKKKIRIQWQFLLMCFYILIDFLFRYIVHDMSAFTTNRVLHNIFYYLIIAFFIKNYFNIDFGIKILRRMSLFATAYIYLQQIIMTFSGYYLPGTLPFLSLGREDLLFYNLYATQATFRPRSIFTEPASFCAYVGLYLTISLVIYKNKQINWKNMFEWIFISGGLLISRSGNGFVILIILWGLYLFNGGYLIKRNLVFIFLIFIIVLFLWNKQAFNDVFVHIRMGGFEGRFSNMFYPFQEMKSIFYLFFGNGMSLITNSIYMPGFSVVIYYYGIVGMLFWLFMYLLIFKKGDSINRRVLILFLVLNCAGNAMFGILTVFYSAFMIKKLNNAENNRNVSIDKCM